MLYTKRADNTVIPVGSIAPGSHTYTRTTFAATAAQTTFTVSYNPNLLEVYINGVLLARTDYTATNGSTIVLATGADLNDVVEVVAFTVYNLNTVLSSNIIGTIPISAGGTNATTAADARTNLGLGTAATTNSTAYATSAQGTLADNAVSAITSTDSSVTVTTTGTSKNLSVSYSGLVGAVPTWNQNTTGNAATATLAATATNVAYSGLTGTVPTWNQNTTGNAATATLAATATNVAYSGLTGTIPTWNQNTTGNAATTTNVAYSGLTGTVPTWNQNTTGTSAGLSSTLVIASGGTGQTTANAAFNALAPSQSGNTGKILSTNGTDTSWVVMTDPTDIAISMAIALG